MSEIDWINTNKNRLYPFDAVGAVTINGLEFPRELIADAGFILGIRAEAAADTAVWLHEVTRTSGGWLLTFRPQVGSHYFRFTIPASAAEGTTIFVDASHNSNPSAEDPEYGTAFIVIGDSANAVFPLGTVTQGTAANSRILPSLVQSLHRHYVRRIHLANDSGVHYLPCGSSPVSISYSQTCPVAEVMSRDLQGNLKFKFGHNARVGVVQADTRLVFGSGIGLGLGVPCQEVVRVPGGPVPDAPTCEGLVYMINGVSPSESGDFTIQAGRGIHLAMASGQLQVEVDPQAHCTGIWS